MTTDGKAYIAGVYEHPTRKADDTSLAQLHAEVAKGALEDAGLTKNDVDGYFCVGGGLGKHQRTARPVGYRAPATEVPDAIERLLRAYLAERRDGESFRAFASERTDAQLRALLAGQPVAAVARDSSPGRIPHGED